MLMTLIHSPSRTGASALTPPPFPRRVAAKLGRSDARLSAPWRARAPVVDAMGFDRGKPLGTFRAIESRFTLCRKLIEARGVRRGAPLVDTSANWPRAMVGI